MADDPSPLRYRTYLWFPVLAVGSILVGSLLQVYVGTSFLTVWLIVLPAMGLFAAAFLGVHGLAKDVQALGDADADWQPSPWPYLGVAVVGTVAIAVVALRPPVPVEGPTEFGPLGATVVGFTLAVAPATTLYLFVRWRRVGLNYL